MSDPTHDALIARIAALEASLRDCLHLLDTSEGYWVTDLPDMRDGGTTLMPLPARLGEDEKYLTASPGTYFRQTFRDTEAVKGARELVGISPSDPL